METIGDAYMVVGGVPEASAFHAQKVANFALDMVEKSHEVRWPATGQPIQVRAGDGSASTGACRQRVSPYRMLYATVALRGHAHWLGGGRCSW